VENIPFKVATPEYSVWEYPWRKRVDKSKVRSIFWMGFGVWGLGFGVWGLGFGVWGLG